MALVNPEGSFAETTTLNNSIATSTFSLQPVYLNLAALSLKGKKARPGKRSSVKVGIKNASNEPFNGSAPLTLTFVEGNQTINLGNFTENLRLKVGKSKSFNLKFKVPSDLAGQTGSLVLTLDSTNALGETYLSDNQTQIAWNILQK